MSRFPNMYMRLSCGRVTCAARRRAESAMAAMTGKNVSGNGYPLMSGGQLSMGIAPLVIGRQIW